MMQLLSVQVVPTLKPKFIPCAPTPLDPMQVSFDEVSTTGAALEAATSSPSTVTVELPPAPPEDEAVELPPVAEELPPVAVAELLLLLVLLFVFRFVFRLVFLFVFLFVFLLVFVFVTFPEFVIRLSLTVLLIVL